METQNPRLLRKKLLTPSSFFAELKQDHDEGIDTKTKCSAAFSPLFQACFAHKTHTCIHKDINLEVFELITEK